MPTLHKRVTALEAHARETGRAIKDACGRIEDLETWTEDEERLRKIAESRIKLLEDADEIHARRIRDLDARMKRRK